MHVEEKDTRETKTAHTPGPWTVVETPTTIGIRADHEHMTIAEMHKVNIGPRQSAAHAEAMADASLISAAPDLLLALQHAERRFSFFDSRMSVDLYNALLAEIHAALAKAEGRS